MMSKRTDERIDRIIQLMASDDSIDAPADSIKWAKDIYRTRAAREGILDRIKAILVMDIRPGEMVAGERSGAAESRQMLFEAGDLAIDLRVSGGGGSSTLRGQVLGEGFDQCSVSLGERHTAIAENGAFVFSGIEPGTYDLSLKAGGKEISASGLRID